MTPEENLARITEEVNEQMRRFGYILPETNQRLLEAQTGIQNFGFKVQMATNIMGNLSAAVGDYTKAMYRGEQGATAFNSSISKMNDAVSTLAIGLSLLVPGGRILKAVTAGLTALGVYALKTAEELTTTARTQADTMYSAFSQLAESGAVGADGIEGLFNDIQKLGLNVTKLDKFLSLAGQNADAMAAMGGTVLKGRQQFAELGRSMAGYNESFIKLGLDQDAQAEAILEYAKTQNKISRGTITDFGQLGKSAYELILQQDALTKVTGLSRKQQQQALDEAQRNGKFLAAQNQIARKFGKADGSDSDTMKQLKMLTTLTKDLGDSTFKGFQDFMSGGAPTAESKALLTVAPELFKLTQQLKAGKFEGDQAGFEKAYDRVLKGMDRSAKSQEQLALFGKDIGGLFPELNKATTQLNRGGLQANLEEAQKNREGQIGDKTGQVAQQAELRKKQNEIMLEEQAFIQTGLPGILKDATLVVENQILDLMKKIRETLGEGVIQGRGSIRSGDTGVLRPPENASQLMDPNFVRTNPNGSNSRAGRVGPDNPLVDNSPLPPWSQQNPLPVIIQEPVPPDLRPAPAPDARPPRMNDPLFPPPRIREHGTSGEIGSLFEPKDIIAKLHKGERVLNKDENSDLTKLFNMVSGEKTQKKMMDAQGEMLKVIDSITNGMKLTANSRGNKELAAPGADISSNGPNTNPVQKTMIDLQGQMLQKMENFAMPTSSNLPALLGDMPKLDINKETVEQIGQTLKDNMGEEFKSAVTSINRLAEQMQSKGDAGLQQQMVGLLEEIRRSQSATAKASGRLAQVASN